MFLIHLPGIQVIFCAGELQGGHLLLAGRERAVPERVSSNGEFRSRSVISLFYSAIAGPSSSLFIVSLSRLFIA